MMDNVNQEHLLDRLKVKIYLFILPFIIFATGIGWMMDFFYSDDPISFSSLLFPILDIWLLISFIYILIKKHFPRFMEISSLALVMFIYLVWFANAMNFNLSAGSMSGGLGEFTNWVPLFFIFVFLIFDRKLALAVSIFIFLATVVIGISISIFHKQSFSIQTYDSLIQFYISNAVYIFALYFLQSLKVGFLQNEAMQQLANTDYLTGLPNRRFIDRKLNEITSQQVLFSVILFDIDYFKHINDRFGHDVGDIVLKKFAALILENIRNEDLVGRWGGEEFMIVANGFSVKEAAALAERLRALVEAAHFPHGEVVTASFGVTEFRVKERLQELLKRADIALYVAKANGRNKVAIEI
jgi:diguanylate cyclase (GGDEF)-like protein